MLYGFIYGECSGRLRVSQAFIDLPMCITRGSQRAGEHVHAFTLKMSLMLRTAFVITEKLNRCVGE